MFIVACIMQPLRSLGCKTCTILVMVSIYLPLPVQSFSYVYYSNPYSFISVREWDEKTRIKTLVLGSMPSTASSFCMFPSFTDLQTGLMAMSKASRLLYIHQYIILHCPCVNRNILHVYCMSVESPRYLLLVINVKIV